MEEASTKPQNDSQRIHCGNCLQFFTDRAKRNIVENITEQPHLLFSDRFISIWTPWDHPKITSQSLQALELLQERLESTFGS